MNQTKILYDCLSLEQVKNSGTSFTCNLCVIRRYRNKIDGIFYLDIWFGTISCDLRYNKFDG